MENGEIIFCSHGYYFQRGCPGAGVHCAHRHARQLELEHGQADPEGAAGLLQLRHPHRAHHQARQLLAEAEDQPWQPEVQIRGGSFNFCCYEVISILQFNINVSYEVQSCILRPFIIIG